MPPRTLRDASRGRTTTRANTRNNHETASAHAIPTSSLKTILGIVILLGRAAQAGVSGPLAPFTRAVGGDVGLRLMRNRPLRSGAPPPPTDSVEQIGFVGVGEMV